ncbi:hypothetical protein MRX96_006954 [Rhipicephalus microplus]
MLGVVTHAATRARRGQRAVDISPPSSTAAIQCGSSGAPWGTRLPAVATVAGRKTGSQFCSGDFLGGSAGGVISPSARFPRPVPFGRHLRPGKTFTSMPGMAAGRPRAARSLRAAEAPRCISANLIIASVI